MMMADGLTRNGKVFDQIIGIGSSEPLSEVGLRKFFANDWSHVKRFEMIENTFEL